MRLQSSHALPQGFWRRPSPKNAWPILVYGLPTLATRMVNQQKSAMQVAEFLQRQAKVARVLYPGLPNFPQRELARGR